MVIILKRDYIISVAMATYNGEKYIKEQLVSILKQLDKKDELIISDDGSTDKTIDIIKSFKDKRIVLIDGPKNGVKQNFANAIEKCNGKYIFLSDQDDIWLDNKVECVLDYFEKTKCNCVTHNTDVVNSDCSEVIIDDYFKYRNSKPGFLTNIYKNRYLGCCMAFDSNMKKYILPIPNDIDMHDQWIGVISAKHGKTCFVNKKLIHYRRHNDTVTDMKHFPLAKMITNRLILIKRLVGR